MKLKVSLASLGMIAALAFSATPAQAITMVAGTINGVDFCATDNNVACSFGTQLTDVSATANVIQLANATIGGVQVDGSLHIQNTGGISLNSSSLLIQNNNAGTVTGTLVVSGTGYSGPVGSVQASGSGTWQSAAGSTATYRYWADAANQQGAENATDTPGSLIFTMSDLAGGGVDSFSNSGGAAFVDNDLFSMTMNMNISLIGGGQLISRGQNEIASPVPEPATMMLLGTGLLAAFRARRKVAGK